MGRGQFKRCAEPSLPGPLWVRRRKWTGIDLGRLYRAASRSQEMDGGLYRAASRSQEMACIIKPLDLDGPTAHATGRSGSSGWSTRGQWRLYMGRSPTPAVLSERWSLAVTRVGSGL